MRPDDADRSDGTGRDRQPFIGDSGMAGDRWWSSVLVSVLLALGAGLAAALVGGLVGGLVGAAGCSAEDDDCLAGFAGAVGGAAVLGGAAAVITVIIMGRRRSLGSIFCAATAAAFVLVVMLPVLATDVTVLAAGILLVGGIAAGRLRARVRPVSPSLVALTVGVVVIGAAATPTVLRLVDTHTEQRRLEAVFTRPLQPDWSGTSPYAVASSAAGIQYDVLEPADRSGSQIADVSVTLRRLGGAPCAGFEHALLYPEPADIAPGPLGTCTSIGAGVWRAQETDGHAHYFVLGPRGQRAHVVGRDVGDADLRRANDSRALQVARSMRPRSARALATTAVRESHGPG